LTEALYDGATLGDLFVRASQRFAARDALVADGRRWTYASLADRVARMGAALRRRGLKPGSSLAICSLNRADVLVLYLSAIIEGIRLTPLAPLSSLADRVFILNDAEIDALVIDSAFGSDIGEIRAGAKRLSNIFTLGGETEDDLTALTDVESTIELIPKRGGEIGMIFYTGGTTGRPKGVVHTMASIFASVMMSTAEWDWPTEVRTLVTTPVSHAGGAFLWPTFLKGGTFHMLPSFAPETFAAYVRREAITVTFLVPTMIYRLLDSDLTSSDLAPLETVVYGAAPITPARLAEALKRFGPIFMQLFGQTEAPNCIAYLAKSQHKLDDPDALASCGNPMSLAQVALLDNACNAVPPGTIGEICVRGPLVMQGYWKRPDESATALDGGWLHTGDMGRFDAKGRLHIVDRKKDMIISGGFNVFPAEIEAILAENSNVASSAVVGMPDRVWGEAVTAVVVLTQGGSLDEEALRSVIRERKGAVYVPKLFVIVNALPTTPVGKIDKKALRALLQTQDSLQSEGR
jgi:fatty-acyl-CoA synthase